MPRRRPIRPSTARENGKTEHNQYLKGQIIMPNYDTNIQLLILGSFNNKNHSTKKFTKSLFPCRSTTDS